MNRIFLITLLIIFTTSCGSKHRSANSEYALKRNAVLAASSYIKQQLSNFEEKTEADGTVSITEKPANFISPAKPYKEYSIYPASVKTGLIDADEIKDAIAVIYSFSGQQEFMPVVLILKGAEKGFTIASVLESDMKILDISDRVITAEVATKSRNSPLRDCHACKEIDKFRFENGSLIRVQ